MINIDIAADLNMVDDAGRNVAALPLGRPDLMPGAVAVAGRAGFWSWVLVEAVTDGVVAFRQVTVEEAAQHGELVRGST